MHQTIKAFIHRENGHYIAECHEIAVVTQGKTIDEVVSNLQEAVALHLEGENLAEFIPMRSRSITFFINTNKVRPDFFGISHNARVGYLCYLLVNIPHRNCENQIFHNCHKLSQINFSP